LEVATGGLGTISYQWEQSTDSTNWSNATGTSNTANYTTPILTSNMYYRRKAPAANCGGTISSNSALVTVAANITQSNPDPTTICSGSTHYFDLTVASGGIGTITYKWQQSTNGSSWSDAQIAKQQSALKL